MRVELDENLDFEEILFDQLKENCVYAISIQLIREVEDKQPIKSVVIFTSSRDLIADEGKLAVQVSIQVGSVVENTL